MNKSQLLPFILCAVSFGASAGEYQTSIDAWHQQRVERLTAPAGWLSLVGLHWLTPPTTQTIGSDATNAVQLAVGPAKLGTIAWIAGQGNFTAASGAEITVDGAPFESGTLLDDANEKPTLLRFGSASLVLIKRGDRVGLRVRDENAATRTGFKGIERFPVDESWRIDAQWVPHATPQTIEVATMVGTLESYANPGVIRFERDGKTHTLQALAEKGSEPFFIIFADRTSGKETYGMARYLYAGPPQEGRIEIDFNKAYNPPCVFTDYATCPMPPEGNRLDLAVRAGELKYAK